MKTRYAFLGLLFIISISLPNISMSQSNIWTNTIDVGTDITYVKLIDIKASSDNKIYVLNKDYDGTYYFFQLSMLNADGTTAFNLDYTTSGKNEVPVAMDIDGNGNCYVLSKSGDTHARVTKFNTSGAEIWSSTWGGVIQLVSPVDIIVDAKSEEVFFTGYFSTATIDEGNNVMLVKFNADGTSAWSKNHNGSNDQDDEGFGLTKDKFGNIYVAADENVTSDIILKYSSLGNLLWKIETEGSQGLTIVNSTTIAAHGSGNYTEYTTTTGAITYNITFPFMTSAANYLKNSLGQVIRIYANGMQLYDTDETLLIDNGGQIKNDAISYMGTNDNLILFTYSSPPTKMAARQYDGKDLSFEWEYIHTVTDIESPNENYPILFAATSDHTMVMARKFNHSFQNNKLNVDKFCLPPTVSSLVMSPEDAGTICSMNTVDFSATSDFATSYSWEVSGAGGINPSGQTATFTGNNYESFNVDANIVLTVDYNGCYTTVTAAELTVKPYVRTGILDEVSNFCDNSGDYLLSDYINDAYTYNWLIDGISVQNSVEETYTITTPGLQEFGLIVYDNNYNCPSDTAKIMLDINSPVIPNLGPDLTSCIGQVVSLDAGVEFENYAWNDNNMSITQDIAVTENGMYTVTVTDINGCTAQDDIIVTFETCTDIEEYPTVNLDYYPNPVRSVMVINTNIEFDGIVITDLIGNVVFSTNTTDNNINISELQQGIYFIAINKNKQIVAAKRFVKL